MFCLSKIRVFIVTFSVFLFGVLLAENGAIAPNNNEANRPWITILVHGTSGSMYTVLNFNDLMNDQYEGSHYQMLQQWARIRSQKNSPSFLFDYGLHKVNLANPKKNKVACGFAGVYQDILKLVDHCQAEKSSYYTFGWSGLLSQTSRRQEAVALYLALSQEIESYKSQGLNPKIRIVCHSHGGNVALNLAGVHATLNNLTPTKPVTSKSILKIAQEILPDQQTLLNQDLCIDELILLATPIQIETEEFVTSPIFKKILNVYSHNDIIQIIDFVSTDGPISKRKIDPCFLTPKIMQIQVSAINHTITQQAQKPATKKTGRPLSNKEAFQKLLKCMAAGRESDDMLPAVEQAVEMITRFSTIPAEKEFDINALKRELQNIQRNMLANPHDPTHSEFVRINISKERNIVSPLPLIAWAPIFCILLQSNNPDQIEMDQHITIHYHGQTVTIEAQNTSGATKKVEIPESILSRLETKMYKHIC